MGKKLITHLQHALLFSTKAYTALKLIRRVIEMLMGNEDTNSLSISLIIWCLYLILKWRYLSNDKKEKQTSKYRK